MVEEEDGDGSRDENGKWKYASNVNENVTKWNRTIDLPINVLDFRAGKMEFFKFEKKQWRYLSLKFLPNKKKECQNLDIFYKICIYSRKYTYIIENIHIF